MRVSLRCRFGCVFLVCFTGLCRVTSVICSAASAAFIKQPSAAAAVGYFLFKGFSGRSSQEAAVSFLLLPLLLLASKRRSEAILLVGWKTERWRGIFFVYRVVVCWLLFVRCGFGDVVRSCAVHTNAREDDECSDPGQKKVPVWNVQRLRGPVCSSESSCLDCCFFLLIQEHTAESHAHALYYYTNHTLSHPHTHTHLNTLMYQMQHTHTHTHSAHPCCGFLQASAF